MTVFLFEIFCKKCGTYKKFETNSLFRLRQLTIYVRYHARLPIGMKSNLILSRVRIGSLVSRDSITILDSRVATRLSIIQILENELLN